MLDNANFVSTRGSMRSSATVVAVLFGLLTAMGSPNASAGDISLTLDVKTAHQMAVKALAGGEYEVTTTGEDPYVFTQPLAAAYDANTQSVIAFETFSLQPVHKLQVFFTPPLGEAHSLSGGAIGSSEGWAPFAMNLAKSETWGAGKRQFRLDFGQQAGLTFRIRGLELRGLTAEELEHRTPRETAVAEERAFGAAIDAYFKASFSSAIRQVAADRDEITVTCHAEEKLVLAEIRPWQHVQLITSVQELEWSLIVEAGAHTVTVPRTTTGGGHPYDRVHSRWCLMKVEKESVSLASHALYCTDDSETAIKSIPVPEPETKKGLQISWRPDSMGMLDELGIRHAAVNIDLCGLLNVPEGTPYVEHTYLGRTFRVNKDVVDNHSRVLAYAAKKKYLVGAIILVNKDAPPGFKTIMHHPDYVSRGIYSMANVTSPEGVFHYAMLIDFLASYFSTEEHGSLHYWIIHNEVDAAWVWSNCGRRGPETMMDFYVKSMRMVYSTVRQYNPSAWVKISLTHFWNAKNVHGPADTMYAPRRLIDILTDHSRVEGDFDWGLAYHCYPRDLRNPQVWKDRVSWRFDTDIISYKNLEVLTAYMQQPQFLRDGKRRKVFLTEQGFSNPNDSKESLRIQAAAMAYGMKKVNGLDGIDAHILHRWVDHAHEGGLNLGLVQKKPGSISTVGAKKPSFDVYAALGTPREEDACRFALELIGIKDWDEIFHSEEIR